MTKISSLKAQRNKLFDLVAKKRKIDRKKELAKREENKLKSEIALLKAETRKGIISKLQNAAKDPKTKEGIKNFKKNASGLFKKIQKFADNMPK